MDGGSGVNRGSEGAAWPLAAPNGSVPPVRRDPARAAAGENFPVVGRLARGPRAAAVRRFYAFARAADDVTDDPTATPAAKLAALDGFGRGLHQASGVPEAEALRTALAPLPQGERATREAAALLGAFRQDARGARYPDWAALMAYCAQSAAPVGRFLLAVHDEGREAERFSDPLCAALQVLNHIQDLRADRDRLARIYLPADMLAAAGASAAALGAPRTDPALRRAVDGALDRCDALLGEAAPLGGAIRSRSLRAQAAATWWLGRRLSQRLRRGDPLARRVAPTRIDFARAGLRGVLAAARGPAR